MGVIPTALDNMTFDYLARFVREKSAIVLDPSKAYLLESRLMPVARDNGIGSLVDLVSALKRSGSRPLATQVIDAMTTNETSFFRDLHPFEALKAAILPDMLERRSKERTLTIWSNACSSGQEVYSIAMMLREHFPVLNAGWRVKLIASDLSTAILKKAQEGVFNQTEVNRGLPMPMLLKYFTKFGLQWQINDEIRRSIEFREVNLVEPWPPTMPSMDIIFLRNVLIYFDPATKTEILRKARKLLKPDGYLFLGGGETMMNLDLPFERTMVGKATVYRPT
jgi:chemotaxis protein methyltransferase CheR